MVYINRVTFLNNAFTTNSIKFEEQNMDQLQMEQTESKFSLNADPNELKKSRLTQPNNF